jgi:hypothetical protein
MRCGARTHCGERNAGDQKDSTHLMQHHLMSRRASRCASEHAWSDIAVPMPDSPVTTVMTLIARLIRQRESVADYEESHVK